LSLAIFFSTFADILDIDVISDGKSFYPLLKGEKYEARKTAFVHYDPKWNKRVSQYRNQFIRTLDYKLYQDGKFYNLNDDILEKFPLLGNSISNDALEIKSDLEMQLSFYPKWK
jgi:arylsulfatase A